MAWISSFLDQIINFFQYIWTFLSQGIYDFLKDALVVATKAAIYSYFTSMSFLVEISFTAAKEIVQALGLSSAVRSAFAALPAPVASALNYFGIPQALNILFSALSTRFVMRFVPLIGR
ncbi:DUF2523 family protein [Metapseudomonas otitidis]|uniref:DUF2523 family protein n=1 Tax=Metapseudomonas otitidis TaxID=319939 RepID=UPI0040556B63